MTTTTASFLNPRDLGTVLAVWAHPDDETFAAGGLLAAAADAGSRIVCLTATRGEHGTSDPQRCPPERLARIRTRELTAALAVLGVAESRWLAFHDGECDQVPFGHGMHLVANVIRDVQPDTIITFGPDGVTGHPDHRAVSRWTTNAWAATRPTARLLWAAVPLNTARRMGRVESIIGAFYPGYPHITADLDLAVHLELSGDRLDRKVVALRSHASQTAAVEHLGDDEFRAWVSTESFVDVAAVRAAPLEHQLAA